MSASATITIGARLAMNAPKERPVWPAMRMFGGSPISVAVPPMLDATISMMISGTGLTSSASASRKVIGTISRIVVTLSRNADSTAVVTASASTTSDRLAARELAGADRQPRVDAGGLGDADHDHHPDEQADRVEVDRLDRLLLIERAGQHDDASRRAARSWSGPPARRRSARARRRRQRRRRPSLRSPARRCRGRPAPGASRAAAGPAANRGTPDAPRTPARPPRRRAGARTATPTGARAEARPARG